MNIENKNFFCYSFRLFHFLTAFDEKCIASNLSTTTGKRYWVFRKSEHLDRVIEFYNEVKHKFN